MRSAVAVDLRQQERREINQPAHVTIFGTAAHAVEGWLQNIGNGGAQLKLPEFVPAFSLIKIEYQDNFLLGEVVYCQDEKPDWLTGVKVEHGMFGLKSLAAALRES